MKETKNFEQDGAPAAAAPPQEGATPQSLEAPETAAPAAAEPAAGEPETPAAAETPAEQEAAPKKKGLSLAGVFAIRKDRQALRATIDRQEAALTTAREENTTLRAEVERLRAMEGDHGRLVQELADLEAEERTVERGVRAELEAIGVPEAAAPGAIAQERAALSLAEFSALSVADQNAHVRSGGRIAG